MGNLQGFRRTTRLKVRTQLIFPIFVDPSGVVPFAVIPAQVGSRGSSRTPVDNYCRESIGKTEV